MNEFSLGGRRATIVLNNSGDGVPHTKTVFGNYSLEEDTVGPNLTPSIFGDTIHSMQVCFFGGPWLPDSYDVIFAKTMASVDNKPIKLLEHGERREKLVDGIVTLLQGSNQPSLFMSTDDVNTLLNGITEEKKLYKRWSKKIKNKTREFAVPMKNLDAFLRTYVKDIILQSPVHPSAHGGEKGWSPLKSLQTHIPVRSVVTFDLSNAFKNIDHRYVFDFFYRVGKDRLDRETNADIAALFTTLTTVYYKDRNDFGLAQGSSVSIPLFNRVMEPIDKVIGDYATKKSMRYSRWVDDFIISAPEDNRLYWRMAAPMDYLLSDNFPIAKHKTFFQQDADIYLLGHKITGRMIIKVPEIETKNRGWNPDAYDRIDNVVYHEILKKHHGKPYHPCVDALDIDSTLTSLLEAETLDDVDLPF